MTTDGIQAVYLMTHNWGKTAQFFQSLGFDLEFDTGHSSGQFRKGKGPYIFVAEVPADREPAMQVVVAATEAEAAEFDPVVDVVTPFEDTHFGTREMTVRDPDGRLWTLQAPAKS